jgi:hypothetical protein
MVAIVKPPLKEIKPSMRALKVDLKIKKEG